jgi:hypothetical protein
MAKRQTGWRERLTEALEERSRRRCQVLGGYPAFYEFIGECLVEADVADDGGPSLCYWSEASVKTWLSRAMRLLRAGDADDIDEALSETQPEEIAHYRH